MNPDDLDRFDPSSVALLFLQDSVMESTLAYKGPLIEVNVRSGKCYEVDRMPDGGLADYIIALRNARLLPLSPAFIDGMKHVLEYAETEAQRRLRLKASRARWKREGREDYSLVDLVAEVEAVCGPGRRRGKSVWFKCPWHEDRTPSLEVTGNVFHSFCCQKAGGVKDWRLALASG